jgi:GNAT superfamily N-acetyltransferase
MFRMVLLRDPIGYSDTFASWLHHQFAYEFGSQPLSEWQREFREGQNDASWRTLIMLEDDQLLGGAALAKNDLPERPELRPWLACVFVAPSARHRGLAERLISGVYSEAQALGITSYTCTRRTDVTITRNEGGNM